MIPQKPIEVYLNLFQRLSQLGLKINNAIDLGCHEGKWAQRFKQFYPGANLYMIDGTDKHADKLSQYGKFIHAYVGQHDEERTFYYSDSSDDETGNSLYKENSNTPFKRKPVFVQTLSNVVPAQIYEYIKMDVQGAELEIIEGSLEMFRKTKWVQLEVPVFQNNVGAPKFEEVINYMANSGFKVFDIENIFYNQRLMDIDILFVNRELPMTIATETTKIRYSHHGD